MHEYDWMNRPTYVDQITVADIDGDARIEILKPVLH